MALRVFFSFHYARDLGRAQLVRNAWSGPGREAAGFWDTALWEAAKRRGGDAISRLIDEHLSGTVVTVVLIGQETANQDYVLYEIERSRDRGNRIVGVRVHSIPDREGYMDSPGRDPFTSASASAHGRTAVPVYDWVEDHGSEQLDSWIGGAAPDGP